MSEVSKHAHHACYPGLVSGFAASLRRWPERDALVVDGRTLSYRELASVAAGFARQIRACGTDDEPLIAVMAHRSLTAYAGVLASLAAGRGYVPLNPKLPAARLAKMLAASECRTIIAAEEAFERLAELRLAQPSDLSLIVADSAAAERLRDRLGGREIVAADGDASEHIFHETHVLPDEVAYLLFTSGSTGEPKGVAVNHRNVRPYVDYIADRYSVNAHDRFSQTFDLTFDLSVHDMFVCWERGACLCSVPEQSVIAPAKFIRDQRLTMWFSVPSAAAIMRRMGMLKPGAFPTLRWSLFCGEALPAEVAAAWQAAAPNSIVENLYGPTEATIAVTRYRWNEQTSPAECVNGVVPIGVSFDGQQAIVIDERGREVEPGCDGELVLGGSQVTGAYWRNVAQTRERFAKLPGRDGQTWYRTGDVARMDARGCLYYLGRTDQQVKIRGYRVELQEIEHAVRQAAGTQEAVCVAWPVRDRIAQGVAAFVCGGHADEVEIIARCRASLPAYMTPVRVVFVGDFPLNANGKVDRGALANSLSGARD